MIMRTIIIKGITCSMKRGSIMKKIKYCCKNLKKHDAKLIYKTMKHEFPELKHKKKDCLGECKTCKQQCFVMLGKNKMICEPTAEKFCAALQSMIS
jgi:uncharacterized protein YuzB (UPF0349 family)